MNTGRFFAIIICFIVISCNRNEVYDSQVEQLLNADTSILMVSPAALETNDSSRKFIRTAELKFKVKSVTESTYDIENTAIEEGGFIVYSHLESNIDYTSITKISSDSSLETTHYTVSNNITIRVPDANLHNTLQEISKNIDFLDYRVIKADDVALHLLKNDLAQKRSANNERRIAAAIEKKAKTLNETTASEEVLFNRQTQSDEAKVANLSLHDQVNFSTITLSIYQRPSIKRELILNDKNIEEYDPSFGLRIAEALKSGWSILENFLVFLVHTWGFLIIALLVWLLIRKYRRQKK